MRIPAKKQIAKGMLLLATVFLTNSPAPAATLVFEGVPVASSADLDTMRGGFVTKNHGFISLSIEKATRIDGVLQVTNSLHIPDMARLVRGLGRFSFHSQNHHKSTPEAPTLPPEATPASQSVVDSNVANQNNPVQNLVAQSQAVQNVTVNEVAVQEVAVEGGPAPQSAAPQVQKPEVAPQASGPAGIASQSSLPQETGNPLEVPPSGLVSQEGLVVLNSGFSTIIQNGLNQKTIQDLTIVEATVVNGKLVREMQLVSRINEQLIDAMH